MNFLDGFFNLKRGSATNRKQFFLIHTWYAKMGVDIQQVSVALDSETKVKVNKVNGK